MKYLHLVWAALMRRKSRTIFTWLSVVVAFILFSVLAAVRFGMMGQLSLSSAERLTTSNKAASGRGLPLSYYPKIMKVTGVDAATYFIGFGGYYKNANNSLQLLMFSPTVFQIFPEAAVSPGQFAKWQSDRQGVIVGSDLAQRMGWKVGETIPIQTKVPQKDGNTTWYFHLEGIYHADLPTAYLNFFIGHYEYSNLSVADPEMHNVVLQYMERINDPRAAPTVSAAVDALFSNSAPQTLTQSQIQEAVSSIRQFGNITAIVVYIGVAVFFSLLLIVGNTLAQSVRERATELAVMRVLGFRNNRILVLIFEETLLLIVSGAVIGLIIGRFVTRTLYPDVGNLLPTFGMTWTAAATGVGLSVVFGSLAALLPMRGVVRVQSPQILNGV